MKNKVTTRPVGMRTWVEINTKELKNNYKIFRSIIPKTTKLCAVVKSNAYGHGLVEFSKEMERLGADFLAVDSVTEGLKLRKEQVKLPIFVLGYTLPELFPYARDNNISITISNFDSLLELEKLSPKKTKLKVHIKVDTGMHRQGFFLSDVQKLFSTLKRIEKKVEVEGLYTHFAQAKNPAFPQYTESQKKTFDLWIRLFEERGYTPIKHAAATGGTMLFPDTHLDMVRIGIGMYGLWPSKEVKASKSTVHDLVPILTWKAVIGEIKIVEAGSGVGYDLTERFTKKTKVAICPVGYWHGYPRTLSSVGHVLVANKRAKILGRVSMDMIAIDVTHIPALKVGDEIILLGRSKDGKEEISAEEVGYMADTVNYEIVTRINPLTRRIYK